MLHSITLQGFKSFADKTRLEFSGGVCAVIGPNGSGKSNVVEALRWATQQARARELRAGRGTELIFHGSGGKAPLGLAEVQVELLTHEGRVNLSRRIYRDGTTEQELNGRGVRVRDVQNALRGTGLGPGGLAVIGQGEVSSVVQAEGKTLLGYLQEAAGLSRSVGSRTETEQRLREADLHLEQLHLVYQERQAQVERLAQAAADARRSRELQTRMALLEDALHRERQLAVRQELAAAQAKAAALLQESETLAGQVTQAAGQLEDSREALAEARRRAEAYSGALDALRAAQEAQAQAERYQDHLAQEQRTLHAELEALPTQPPAGAAPELAKLEAGVAQARSGAEAAERGSRQLEQDLLQAQRQAARRAEASARQEASEQTLRAELLRAEGNLETVELRLQAQQEALAQAVAGRTAAAQAEAQAREQGQATQEQQREAEAQRTRLQAAFAPLLRERQRLEQTLNSYARYGEGARNALRLEHSGIVGSVADLLEVPAEYETAVTAALGRRLEQIVVHSGEDARDIIEELKRVGGRATFLPLDLLRPRQRRDGALLREQGVIGNLADLCPTDPALVGEAILADTLVVQDLSAANRLARAYATRPRLVTLEGELLEAGGAITGGRLRDTGFSVLADQRRFQELDAELEDAERQMAALEAQATALQTQAAAYAAQLPPLRQAREEAERLERAAERHLTELSAQAGALRETKIRLTQRLEAQAPALPVAEIDLAALEAELLALRTNAEEARSAERAALEELELGRQLDAAWRSFRGARLRAAELRERLATNGAAQEAQRQHLEAAATEVHRRQVALGDLDERELYHAEQAKAAADAAYAALLGQQNTVRAGLEEARMLIARREGHLEDLPDGCSPAGSPREWNSELGRARTELQQLGPVNARAEADYQTEQAALLELQAEWQDAAGATGELQEQLQLLEQAEAQATQGAYERVARAFAEYSAELLGGQGELETERDPTGRLIGLRLAVQPRGKRTRAMNLLSAGERTMAGLGFLFALNHAGGEGSAGGLPLAVLDEVDAPLDEANIRRFTAFLQRFSERGAQFVLVTHQKATMEVAHTLWGVTTDQSGASRVLSIKQSE